MLLTCSKRNELEIVSTRYESRILVNMIRAYEVTSTTAIQHIHNATLGEFTNINLQSEYIQFNCQINSY